jgi:tetratricopeptide (TPR) repeat protein
MITLFLFFALGPATACIGHTQANSRASAFTDAQAAEKANTHEDDLYKSGTESLNNGDYESAVSRFDEVAKMRGRRAAAALFWKGYAFYKAGNKDQALAAFADLKKNYPESKYVRDAGPYEVEMQGTAARPDQLTTDEEKAIALEVLMRNDPDKAIPYADKWLRAASSTKTKEKILFVFSESGSDKAQQALVAIAKNNSDPDLQKRAIRYLGMNGSGRNRAALKEIYASAATPEVKKAVFQAWMLCGDKESVLSVAQQEKSPELRKDAIRQLGIMGGRQELRELYKQTTDTETKDALLQAMGVGGDVQGMTEIAQSDKDPEVRRRAVRNLGIFGGHQASGTLVSIYNSQTDLGTKKEVINALFLSGSAKELVAMARKETDPELKKALIQKMSLMSSPEITEYMLELLNK